MGDALSLIGFISLLGGILLIIIALFKKQKGKVKAGAIWTLASFILFAVGIAISPSETAQTQVGTESSQSTDMAQSSQPKPQNTNLITKEEYDNAKTDMTYDEVKNIIGGEGKEIWESGDKDTDAYTVDYIWYSSSWGVGPNATLTFQGKTLKLIFKQETGLE